MDDLKFNKFAAGLLCGGLLIMAGIKGAEILLPHHTLEQNAYPIEVADTAGAVTEAAEAPSGPEPILAMLETADLAAGEKISQKCSACHSFNDGGKNKVGPNLWNIVNAGQGQVSGFAYSAALAGLGGQWSYAELNGFLHKPKTWVEGTKMNYNGLKKPKDRPDLIAWLRSLSVSPAPLPTAEEIASEAAQ